MVKFGESTQAAARSSASRERRVHRKQRLGLSERISLRRDVIIASCAACKRRAHVAAALLRHGRPPYARLLDLERKLWCSGCGNRQGNTLTVSMAPRN
jgi:hypothetical protein